MGLSPRLSSHSFYFFIIIQILFFEQAAACVALFGTRVTCVSALAGEGHHLILQEDEYLG